MGKSTQIPLLKGRLEAGGVTVVTTREPGGTPIGDEIRGLLLRRRSADSLPPQTELLLVMASRAALVRDLVEPTLARGQWVLADRYDLSTFAYQGSGRGVDRQRIECLNRYATKGLKPDLTVVLDLPSEEWAARRMGRRVGGGTPDRIESAGRDFRLRVAGGYLELARSRQEVEVVHAGGSVERVADRVWRAVRAHLGDRLRPKGGH